MNDTAFGIDFPLARWKTAVVAETEGNKFSILNGTLNIICASVGQA